MVTKAIEIIDNIHSVTAVKDQSENVVDSLASEIFYGYHSNRNIP